MKIRELVKELPCRFYTAGGERICADSGIEAVLNKEIVEITNDSRKVVPGSLFFCIIGANSDGQYRRQRSSPRSSGSKIPVLPWQ